MVYGVKVAVNVADGHPFPLFIGNQVVHPVYCLQRTLVFAVGVADVKELGFNKRADEVLDRLLDYLVLYCRQAQSPEFIAALWNIYDLIRFRDIMIR